MPTRSRYVGRNLEFYDSGTQERTLPTAACVFYDDFVGFQLNQTESGSKGTWSTVEVLLNTAIAQSADAANGAVSIALDSDNNAEDGVLYWGDQRAVNLKAGAIFETRIDMAVIAGTGVSMVWGLAGDHNLDKDTVTEAAWFKLDASAAVVCETDDTTNNNDDIASGVTMVAGTYNVFRIDCTVLSDVRFYIDGASVATGTTFDMSNLTDAEAVMQPYFSIDKGATTEVGSLLIDYCRVWWNRTT